MKRGVDAAHGDNTSTLKDLITAWINESFHLSQLLNSDKHMRSFMHNICGNLLCPANMKAGICNRILEYIVSENSWPWFVYEGYSVNNNNLKQGLFKSRILVQAFKAIFTLPSSAKEADGDGNGADILENNRHTQQALNQAKVKTCVASIINMRKVTPHTITYVCFALSSISSWHTVDGDFDYKAFWNNVIDFFEDVPGPVTQCRVDILLKWWTKYCPFCGVFE
ncbi:hypothetical protein EDD22DRAFT_788505 [Suillus occidentalis]|nr:hypothetical protein EDD22DRAFT_788505 [Suillus occidentalis]